MLNYKRLGDYICEVDVRNRDLSVTHIAWCEHIKGVYPFDCEYYWY